MFLVILNYLRIPLELNYHSQLWNTHTKFQSNGNILSTVFNWFNSIFILSLIKLKNWILCLKFVCSLVLLLFVQVYFYYSKLRHSYSFNEVSFEYFIQTLKKISYFLCCCFLIVNSPAVLLNLMLFFIWINANNIVRASCFLRVFKVFPVLNILHTHSHSLIQQFTTYTSKQA